MSNVAEHHPAGFDAVFGARRGTGSDAPDPRDFTTDDYAIGEGWNVRCALGTLESREGEYAFVLSHQERLGACCAAEKLLRALDICARQGYAYLTGGARFDASAATIARLRAYVNAFAPAARR